MAVLAAEAGIVEDEFICHQPLHGIDGFLAGSAHLLHLCLQAEGLGKGKPKEEKMRKGFGISAAWVPPQPSSLTWVLPFAGAVVTMKQPHLPSPSLYRSTDAGLDWCLGLRLLVLPTSP